MCDYINFATPKDLTGRKVFGIGAHKTGTSSLAEALNILGIRTNHWKHHNEISDDIKNNNFKLRTLEYFDAVCDNPIPSIYKELDIAYPNSKFILTIRDEEKWIASLEEHTGINYQDLPDGLKYARFLFYGIWYYDRDIYLRRYREHNRDVQNYFRNRPDDLLIMNITIGNGWKELCNFLGVSEQPVQNFPHDNKRLDHTYLSIKSYFAQEGYKLCDNIRGGNCGPASISQLLYNNQDHHINIREKAMDHLGNPDNHLLYHSIHFRSRFYKSDISMSAEAINYSAKYREVGQQFDVDIAMEAIALSLGRRIRIHTLTRKESKWYSSIYFDHNPGAESELTALNLLYGMHLELKYRALVRMAIH